MFLLGTSVVQDQISGIDTAIKEEWEWNAQANKGPAKYWTCKYTFSKWSTRQ